MLKVGLDAFDETFRVPLVVPARVGLYTIENVALCPALSVSGKVKPLSVNPLEAAV